MTTVAAGRPTLPKLALEEWEDTKDTLHLWLQIVGKVRLASAAPRNHWWHAPLYVDVRGLTTRRMHASSGTAFEIRFDFVDHRLGSPRTAARSRHSTLSTVCRWPTSTRSCTGRCTGSASR